MTQNTPQTPFVTGFQEQDENGIDLSQLKINLRLTPTERLEKHQQALKFVMEVRRAGRAARLSRPAQTS